MRWAKFALLTFIVFHCWSCSVNAPTETPPSFTGSSIELKATEVVPTLSTPISIGKSAIWCASFVSALKTLAETNGQGFSTDEKDQVVESLSSAADPKSYIPNKCLYVISGTYEEAVTNIDKTLRLKFPNKKLPSFPGALPSSFLCYAYLAATLRFNVPYDESPTAFVFTDSIGKKTEIQAFGILAKNHNSGDQVWNQPYILFQKGEPGGETFEFAIDLCSNSFPSQVVVAKIPRKADLAAALSYVELESQRMADEIEAAEKRMSSFGQRRRKLEALDDLLVPKLHWEISHHFREIEGKTIANGKFKGNHIDIARQDIVFHLDRFGARISSDADSYASGIPTHFLLDQPFLVYMKKRGAVVPYFAMWVDNAELLSPWTQ